MSEVTGRVQAPVEVVTLRCWTATCRIETFKGTAVMPLNICPGCQTVAGVVVETAPARTPSPEVTG